MKTTLSDNAEGHFGVVDITVRSNGSFLEIQPHGYGEPTAEPPGSPVCLELYEGRLRLIVWNDINEEEPRILDLEGARETCRKADCVHENGSL